MNFSRLAACGLGSGLSPVAPGTAGSLVGIALGAPLLALSHGALAAGMVAAAALGFWSVPRATGLALRTVAKGTHDDPGWVVIDEIAGQMLALLALPHPSIAGCAAAFLLFRLFDIWKPGPIGWLDAQGGALGIMADDLAAGLLAGLVLLGAALLLPGMHALLDGI